MVPYFSGHDSFKIIRVVHCTSHDFGTAQHRSTRFWCHFDGDGVTDPIITNVKAYRAPFPPHSDLIRDLHVKIWHVRYHKNGNTMANSMMIIFL